MNFGHNTSTKMDINGPPPFILLANPTLLVYFYRYGLGLIFLLGFTGNLASFFTFLRPVLRTTSTGWLFLILAVSDTAFLLVEIFDFIEVGVAQAPIFLAYYAHLCRFRWFIKGLFQFQSGWILALVAIDRWLRARFPFKASRWCTRRNNSVAMLVVLMISCIDVYRIIRKERGRVQPRSITTDGRRRQRQERSQAQMLLLAISSIVIFVATTLPINLCRIVTAYEIAVQGMTNLFEIVTQVGILTIVVSLNYAVSAKYVFVLFARNRRKPHFSP